VYFETVSSDAAIPVWLAPRNLRGDDETRGVRVNR